MISRMSVLGIQWMIEGDGRRVIGYMIPGVIGIRDTVMGFGFDDGGWAMVGMLWGIYDYKHISRMIVLGIERK